jgi:hypothetical protein
MLFAEFAFQPDAETDAVPSELRDLAALLAWRRCAQEAVVPVAAMIEPPAPRVPDHVLMERYPLIEV